MTDPEAVIRTAKKQAHEWEVGFDPDTNEYDAAGHIYALIDAWESDRAALVAERDAAIAAVGEPCAECGHIDWRSDPVVAHPPCALLKAAKRVLAIDESAGFPTEDTPFESYNEWVAALFALKEAVERAEANG